MTDEARILAGRVSDEDFKLLRWCDLIEFAEIFGVGLEETEKLSPANRLKAAAWLEWKIHCLKTKEEIPFDEWLKRPISDFFPQETTENA